MSLSNNRLYTDQGISLIAAFLEKIQATTITAVNETIGKWILRHEKRFHSGLLVCLSPNRVVDRVISKTEQIAIARRTGLRVLDTYIIHGSDFAVQQIPQAHYPLCLRPSEPDGVYPSFKVIITNTADEMQRHLRKMERVSKPIIAQPFRKLPNLVIHGARTVSGENIGMKAFLVERKFEGVTLTLRRTELDSMLKKRCILFTNLFELVGNYHFEFLYCHETKESYFLEINHRFGGTTAKVFACGYDEPALALKAFGLDTKVSNTIRDVRVSNKQALLKYIYVALKNRLTPLDYPEETKIKRILMALVALLFFKDEVFSFRDIRGAFALYFGNLRKRL